MQVLVKEPPYASFKTREELRRAVLYWHNRPWSRGWGVDQEDEATIQEKRQEVIANYGHFNEWDVSLVTDMSSLFYNVDVRGDLSNWDVSNVQNMESMFASAGTFDGNGIAGWDVSSCVNMKSMFRFAAQFNGDISQWNVGNVKNMDYMLQGARRFRRDLSGWDVGGVQTSLEMFEEKFKRSWRPRFGSGEKTEETVSDANCGSEEGVRGGGGKLAQTWSNISS